MVIVDGQELFEEHDLREKVRDIISYKPRMKDINGIWYTFEEFCKHFVVMVSEFGYRRCFKYSEVYYRLK